jgi:hypothetical protein
MLQRRTVTKTRSVAGSAAAIGLALALTCAACSSAGPAVYSLRSGYEALTPHDVVRDCGYSVPVRAGTSLWLFCDTEVTTQRGQEVGYPILGTDTAAEGPYAAGQPPGDLKELPTPGTAADRDGAPEPFLPAPQGLTMPSGVLPCAGVGAYPARWITGAAAEPGTGRVLISYIDYCVSGASAFTAEAFGLVEYDPAANTLGPPVTVFRAVPGQQIFSRWLLGSPVFDDGYLYLFSAGRGIFLARVAASPGAWGDGYAYRYWTGRDWSAGPAAGASLTGAGPAQDVSAGDYRSSAAGFLLVVQTGPGAADFWVWHAATLAGPWRRVLTGRVPCEEGTEPGAASLCRAIIGHPELSKPGQLFLSFFDPAASHVELAPFSIPASAPAPAG